MFATKNITLKKKKAFFFFNQSLLLFSKNTYVLFINIDFLQFKQVKIYDNIGFLFCLSKRLLKNTFFLDKVFSKFCFFTKGFIKVFVFDSLKQLQKFLSLIKSSFYYVLDLKINCLYDSNIFSSKILSLYKTLQFSVMFKVYSIVNFFRFFNLVFFKFNVYNS